MTFSTAGMTECEREGISGNCGPDCRKYISDGGCEEYDAEHMDEKDTLEAAYKRAMSVVR